LFGANTNHFHLIRTGTKGGPSFFLLIVTVSSFRIILKGRKFELTPLLDDDENLVNHSLGLLPVYAVHLDRAHPNRFYHSQSAVLLLKDEEIGR